MIDHHIQKELLHKLVLTNHARFTDLRPKDVDSNVITYHLQQLIKQKLVAKDDNGAYMLTELGKVAGINVKLSKKELLQQAHPILLMALRDGDKWLLRTRKAQPMIDKTGFTHCEPIMDQPATDTASTEFEKRTGLNAVFKPKGFGYIRLMKDGELVSFTNFTLLIADSFEGELVKILGNGENDWYESLNLDSVHMIPSMQDLMQNIQKPGMFFFDKSYEV
jgi:hypothetical protein